MASIRLLVLKLTCLVLIVSVTPLPSHALDRAGKLAKKAKTVQTNTCQGVKDSDSCHSSYAEGCTNAAKQNTYDPFLAYLKNQTSFPKNLPKASAGTFTSLADFQALDKESIKLKIGKQQRDFAPDLAKMGQGNVYTLVGYLYYAVPGGIETCNCKLKTPTDKDFHIGIGFDSALAKSIADGDIDPRSKQGHPPTKAEQTSVIVEMTPHFRSEFHPQWTLPKLQDAIGSKVKVIGQLVLDNEHANTAQDCGLQGAKIASCWRGSAWELHPVLEFLVCPEGTACAADSEEGWVELKDFVIASSQTPIIGQ